jgi:hypothetical protein
MKNTLWLLIALSTLSIGVFGAGIWSANLGKRVWAPGVFAWHNPLRQPPQIDLQPDSPLLISNPRYYSFMSIGSSVGGTLRFNITNQSKKPIHSYQCRYFSPVSVGNGAYGSQPEEGLLPGRSREDGVSSHEYAPLTLTIDFVQFADGTTWFSGAPDSIVKPEGLRAGAKAAANYLLTIMSRDGVQTVMDTLPRIHAEVSNRLDAPTNSEFGVFGHYCGVTNTVVRVEHEYNDGGLQRVEAFLRSYRE